MKYLKDRDREGSTDVVIAWWLAGKSDQKTEKQQQSCDLRKHTSIRLNANMPNKLEYFSRKWYKMYLMVLSDPKDDCRSSLPESVRSHTLTN